MQSQNFVWQYLDEKEKKIHCRKHFLQRQRGLYHILLISRSKKRKKIRLKFNGDNFLVLKQIHRMIKSHSVLR